MVIKCSLELEENQGSRLEKSGTTDKSVIHEIPASVFLTQDTEFITEIPDEAFHRTGLH